MALDSLGRVVWAWPTAALALPRTPLRARLSLDGGAILYIHPAGSVTATCQLVRIPLDGESSFVEEVAAGHTDFDEHTPGGYLLLGWEIRDFDGRRLLGDPILEVATDGTQREVFHAFDAFEPNLSRPWGHYYAPHPEVEDDATEDAIYVTTSFHNGVVKIDRASGATLWTLSDDDDTGFVNRDEERLLFNPHSVEPIEGGVVLFNRGNFSASDTCSEVVDIARDADAGTAERVWDYEGAECLLTTFLGNAQRLPGGNALATWAVSGQIDEATPAGEVAWCVNLAIGAAMGFAGRVPTLGDGTIERLP